MSQAALAKLMNELGWGSGFKLPVATEENQALERLLEEKQKEILRLTAVLEDDSSRIDNIRGHTVRVQNEIAEAQKVVFAKRKAIETEKNLISTADRGFSKIKDDHKLQEQKHKAVKHWNKLTSADLEKRRRNVDELIELTNFDKEAMCKYNQRQQDQESYIEYIERFLDIDDKTIVETKKKCQKLSEQVTFSQMRMENAVLDTFNLQVEYERICTTFRRVHKERNEAVELWQSTLDSMATRDEAMKEVAEDYISVKSKLQNLQEEICHKESMLNSEKVDKRSVLFQLEGIDRRVAGIRDDIKSIRENQQFCQDALLNSKTETAVASNTMKKVQNETKALKEEMETWRKRIEKAEKEVVSAKKALEKTKTLTMSADEESKELDALIDEEERKVQICIADLSKHRKAHWLRQCDLKKLQTGVLKTQMEIRNSQLHLSNKQLCIEQASTEAQKRKAEGFQLDMKIYYLTTRLDRLLKPRQFDPDLYISQQEKLEQTKRNVQKIKKEVFSLLNQTRFVDSMNNQVLTSIKSSRNDLKLINAFCISLRLDSDRMQKDLKQAQIFQNEKAIEFRLVKVSLHRILQAAKEQSELLFDLEHHRLVHQKVAKERKGEIEIHMNLLVATHRTLSDEKSRLKLVLSDITDYIEKLKKKYEIIMYTMESDKSRDDDTMRSEAYYIVKHAEEKATLEREGDMWDKRVKDAEDEITALQNTLALLTSSNNAFKDSLAPAIDNTPEGQLMKQLESTAHELIRKKMNITKELTEFKEQLERKQAELVTIRNTYGRFKIDVAERAYELNNVLSELRNQKLKIHRANLMANKLVRELCLQNENEKLYIETELKARMSRLKYHYAGETTLRLLHTFPQMQWKMFEFCKLHNLKQLAKTVGSFGTSGKSTPARSGRTSPVISKSVSFTPTIEYKEMNILPEKKCTPSKVESKTEGEDADEEQVTLKEISSPLERDESDEEAEDRLPLN